MAAGTHPGDEAHLHVQAQQRVVHGEQRQAVARRQRQVGRRPERQRHRLLRHVLCGPPLPLRLEYYTFCYFYDTYLQNYDKSLFYVPLSYLIFIQASLFCYT